MEGILGYVYESARYYRGNNVHRKSGQLWGAHAVTLGFAVSPRLLVGAPYSNWVSNTVWQRRRDHDSLRSRGGLRIACVLRFRFRVTKMDELDRMRGRARLRHHLSLASFCSTDAE